MIGKEPTNTQDKVTVLQSKLYAAASADRKRRFYALYDKLYLDHVLQVAWEQVRTNKGAPGPDGISITQIESAGVPEFLLQLATELRDQTYRPKAVRHTEIPKDNGKTRVLGIPNVRDRIVQTAVKLLLEPIFEADFEETSYGFRPGIGQGEALAAVAQNGRQGLRWVVDADIEACFDNIDHDKLMAALRQRITDGTMLSLIHKMLKAGILVAQVHHDTDTGTPQGGPLSPLLANVLLHHFDTAHKHVREFRSRLTRYADDFIIQCPTETEARRALVWIEHRLRQLGLKLNPAKTRLVCDTEGFDFLGLQHRRLAWRSGQWQDRLTRWPSPKSRNRFRAGLRDTIRSVGWAGSKETWSHLKRRVNLFVEGWGRYFCPHTDNLHQLFTLDQHVGRRLARHLARSQPVAKGRRKRSWIKLNKWLTKQVSLKRLHQHKTWDTNPYRSNANVRWKAV